MRVASSLACQLVTLLTLVEYQLPQAQWRVEVFWGIKIKIENEKFAYNMDQASRSCRVCDICSRAGLCSPFHLHFATPEKPSLRCYTCCLEMWAELNNFLTPTRGLWSRARFFIVRAFRSCLTSAAQLSIVAKVLEPRHPFEGSIAPVSHDDDL